MRLAIPPILCVVVLGCSQGPRTKPSAPPSPEGEQPARDEQLPPPTLSDETLRKTFAASPRYRLSFTKNSEWSLADVEKTDARLNGTDVSFTFNDIPLGSGTMGLANLRRLLFLLPRGSVVMADHCLTCQENRWSKRIRTISKEGKAKNDVTVECDGAF